ncbi:MAG: phosphate signaling complex protein PhoU [Methylococcales bacterium]|nr:phosphate signaling complex protein PhoU [Methylococcales bacterium]
METNNNKLGHHISEQFNRELEDIRNKVLTMGGLVEQQIKLATQAFSKGDVQLAEEVIKQDDRVNNLELEIDRECIKIIALRQPTAFDLRLLISVIKTITEIERVGDQAKRIAEMAIHLAGGENQDDYYELQHISEMVSTLLHNALDAFARLNIHDVVTIKEQVKKVNREYKGIVRQLITKMMEDPRSISQSLDLLWTARALERVGDHACNMSEYIIYMVKGEDVRHLSAEELSERIQSKA